MSDHADARHADAERWLTIHDELLRGLTHALSNRVGTILAVVSMVDVTTAAGAAALQSLRNETERLEALLAPMRQLPRRPDGVAEPILPDDVVRAAIDLHAYHPDARALPCEVTRIGDVAPAWADPAALELAIVVALAAAVRQARDMGVSGGAIGIAVSSNDDVVRFDVGHGVAAPTDVALPGTVSDAMTLDAAAAQFLLGAGGGSVVPHERGMTIEVASLAAKRRARTR